MSVVLLKTLQKYLVSNSVILSGVSNIWIMLLCFTAAAALNLVCLDKQTVLRLAVLGPDYIMQ